MKIKAAIVRSHNDLVVDEVELENPKPGEVLVRLRAAGVCHSDLHTLRGELRAQPPIVLGHEGAGIVESTGDGVTKVSPGDHVMINWLPGCQKCGNCLAGSPTLCQTFPSTTFQGFQADGTSRIRAADGSTLKQFLSSSTMAEYTVVSEQGVIPIPQDVPFEVAAITCCAVMTGVGAVLNTAQVTPGSSAALIGCGGVGLSILLGLKLAGCYPIIAVDVLDSKLDFARELGATETINAKENDAVEAIRKLTGGRGATYVFDSVGAPATISQSVAAASINGTATISGMHNILKPVPIPADLLIFNNKRLQGSFAGSGKPLNFLPRLIELYRGGRLDIGALISRRYQLEQISMAFDDMEAGEIARGVLVMN